MGKVCNQKLVFEAQVNIAKTWQDLFAHPQVTDPNQPLTSGYKSMVPIGLWDPKNPANAVILFIYQMNNFCFKELNRSSRVND